MPVQKFAIAAFSEAIRDVDDPGDLAARLATVVAATIEPSRTTI